MPTFEIHVVNSEFHACNDVEAVGPDEAKSNGLRAALGIGADEVCAGKPFFGAEVVVKRDGELQSRLLVSIGQTPLL